MPLTTAQRVLKSAQALRVSTDSAKSKVEAIEAAAANGDAIAVEKLAELDVILEKTDKVKHRAAVYQGDVVDDPAITRKLLLRDLQTVLGLTCARVGAMVLP